MKNETLIHQKFVTFTVVSKFMRQFSKLTPRHNIKRVKRGLINGLGSIIKSL